VRVIILLACFHAGCSPPYLKACRAVATEGSRRDCMTTPEQVERWGRQNEL